MAVARMKRLEMAGLLADRERWLEALQTAEVVEIEQFEPDAPGLGNESEIRRGSEEEMTAIEREMGDIERALTFIDRYHPVRPNFIQQFAGIKLYLTPDEFAQAVQDRRQASHSVNRCVELNEALAGIASERASLLADRQLLAGWLGLNLHEDDLAGTAKAKVILGTVDQRKLGAFREELAQAPFGLHLEIVSENERTANVVFFVPRSAGGELNALLGAADFNAVTLPPYGSSIEERLEIIAGQLTRLQAEEDDLLREVDGLAPMRVQLQTVYDFLKNERFKLAAAGGFAAGKHSFYFRGWIRLSDIASLERAIAGVNQAHYVLVRDPGDDEEPPSTFENQPLVTPFEYLVQGFSYPKYTELDPTRLMAPFFFLFFGFALGDAGYGILLALINVALLKFLPMTGIGKRLAVMFAFGSISSVAIGLGTAGFFGDIFKLPPLFGFDPVSQPVPLLIMALAFGAVQMFFGLAVSGVLNARQSGIGAALAKEGAWMLFLGAATVYIVAFMGKEALGLQKYTRELNYALAGTAVLVILGATYGRKGLSKVMGIPAGLFALYNSIGFFSDILSYSRVMALALSGAVVGNVVNMFVRSFVQAPLFGLGYLAAAVVFVFGHALNMGLAVLGAYVHATRLQYLEFFGKFFEGGGRAFRPFKPDYKYTQLIQKREA